MNPPDDYDYNLNRIQFITLLHYIKETVNILINQKTKQIQPVSLNWCRKMLQKLWRTIEKVWKNNNELIKIQSQDKLQIETMEKQIKDYKEMEESFEQMKEKYKYPEGKFLENEIKDNEILIIRAENTNLKNVINQLEKDKMNIETDIINELKNQIELINSKEGTSESTLKNINSNKYKY